MSDTMHQYTFYRNINSQERMFNPESRFVRAHMSNLSACTARYLFCATACEFLFLYFYLPQIEEIKKNNSTSGKIPISFFKP